MPLQALSRRTIRPIEPRDDYAVLEVIQAVREEFRFESRESREDEGVLLSQLYGQDRSAYFVVELDDVLQGGAGISPLSTEPRTICELQRMYIQPSARGHGCGKALLDACLESAQRFGYRQCYLKTAGILLQAARLYELSGFRRLSIPLPGTQHSACDTYFLRELAAG